MVVLDTSAVLFWTLNPEMLSSTAATVIAREDQLLMSSISIWEIGIKVKRGKLVLPLSVREYVERLRNVDRVEILAVDELAWLDSLDLEWEHRDPADRVIVATARRFGCPLVTSDTAMAQFYERVVW